ncbi:MAG TPA: M14 family zinc carboxypeptidase [Candidatus Polarisedimenticolaceae bacterium]
MIAFLLAAAVAAPPDLTTEAEKSGWVRTGRYAEVERLCPAFEKAFPGKVRCTRFGTTPEGRPMLALVASADGAFDPKASRAKGRTVVLAQGGIHAGEIDGKDAGFAVLRDVLNGKTGAGVLSRITFVFVPVFNVDGHERFGPNHRPNQRGPEAMGWRTTAQNLNLNRDYAKAEAPEMHAMLALLNAWDPELYVDLHVTDGAKFRHDVAILVDPAEEPRHPLREPARKLRHEIASRLEALGHRPLEFYPAFEKDDDPASGFAVGVAPPRLSTPYWAARGRMALLVETHSWHRYAERVDATRHVLEATLELAARDGTSWRAAIDAPDSSAELGIAWAHDDPVATIEFLGYAYARRPSAISGGMTVDYDETKPETWRIPLRTGVKAARTARLPKAGWIVPPAWAPLVRDKLAAHGFRTETIGAARTSVTVEVWRAASTTFAVAPYEGRRRVEAEGSWTGGTRDVAPGSLFVPAAQPGARLLVQLLEPEAPDSLVSWGYFDAIFERKEYMESYVTEEVAAAMLRDDPAVRAEFERRLSDPKFAADPNARLEFFHRRHASWDDRKDVYPVVKVDAF